MATKGGGSRNTWILLLALAGMLAWTHSMQVKTRALKAKAAAARTQTEAPPALGFAGGAARARPEVLASLRVAPWGDDPYFKASAVAPRAARGASSRPAHRAWKPTGTGLRLNGILFGGAGSTAQICDRVAGVGETVYGWKVLSIAENSVTLADRGAVITLHLHEGSQ